MDTKNLRPSENIEDRRPGLSVTMEDNFVPIDKAGSFRDPGVTETRPRPITDLRDRRGTQGYR